MSDQHVAVHHSKPASRGLKLSMPSSYIEHPPNVWTKKFQISIESFSDYVHNHLEKTKHAISDGYDDEFHELYSRCSLAYATRLEYQSTPKTSKKNRYCNVLPYVKSRVHLMLLENDPSSDYINASFIKSDLPGSEVEYISTQAPIPSTIVDFWRMVLEQNSNIIIMLTSFKEDDTVKSDIYWLDHTGKTLTYGIFTIQMIEKTYEKHTVHRRIILTNLTDSTTRTIDHIQYVGWPDQDVPTDMRSFVCVLAKFREFRYKRSGPVIVHCSAGIGRSGTFIAIDILLDSIHHSLSSNDASATTNIVDVVYHLRTQRKGMVQTKKQYRFIYTFLEYCLECHCFGLHQ